VTQAMNAMLDDQSATIIGQPHGDDSASASMVATAFKLPTLPPIPEQLTSLVDDDHGHVNTAFDGPSLAPDHAGNPQEVAVSSRSSETGINVGPGTSHAEVSAAPTFSTQASNVNPSLVTVSHADVSSVNLPGNETNEQVGDVSTLVSANPLSQAPVEIAVTLPKQGDLLQTVQTRPLPRAESETAANSPHGEPKDELKS
jgi:hypothetical protein